MSLGKLWRKEMQLQALEDSIPDFIIGKVVVSLGKSFEDIRKMSIYQILILFLAVLKKENENLAMLEGLKMWMQPEIFARLREMERNKRVNIDFLKRR